MLKVLRGSSVCEERRLVNHPCVDSPLSFSPLLRCFINHSENVYSPGGPGGVDFITHTHTYTEAHKGVARQYITCRLIRSPLETYFSLSSCIQIDPTLFGEAAHSPAVPLPLPLIVTSFSQREAEPVAGVLDFSYQPPEGGVFTGSDGRCDGTLALTQLTPLRQT